MAWQRHGAHGQVPGNSHRWAEAASRSKDLNFNKTLSSTLHELSLKSTLHFDSALSAKLHRQLEQELERCFATDFSQGCHDFADAKPGSTGASDGSASLSDAGGSAPDVHHDQQVHMPTPASNDVNTITPRLYLEAADAIFSLRNAVVAAAATCNAPRATLTAISQAFDTAAALQKRWAPPQQQVFSCNAITQDQASMAKACEQTGDLLQDMQNFTPTATSGRKRSSSFELSYEALDVANPTLEGEGMQSTAVVIPPMASFGAEDGDSSHPELRESGLGDRVVIPPMASDGAEDGDSSLPELRESGLVHRVVIPPMASFGAEDGDSSLPELRESEPTAVQDPPLAAIDTMPNIEDVPAAALVEAPAEAPAATSAVCTAIGLLDAIPDNTVSGLGECLRIRKWVDADDLDADEPLCHCSTGATAISASPTSCAGAAPAGPVDPGPGAADASSSPFSSFSSRAGAAPAGPAIAGPGAADVGDQTVEVPQVQSFEQIATDLDTAFAQRVAILGGVRVVLPSQPPPPPPPPASDRQVNQRCFQQCWQPLLGNLRGAGVPADFFVLLKQALRETIQARDDDAVAVNPHGYYVGAVKQAFANAVPQYADRCDGFAAIIHEHSAHLNLVWKCCFGTQASIEYRRP